MTDDDAELRELRAPLPPLAMHGPICSGLERAVKAMREQSIELVEVHMTQYVHDALLAELGVDKVAGLRLDCILGVRIVIK
jgi:hypothetical protein